jgi:large subunit ribosomal protein L6
MSRIGKKPIVIPQGVEITVEDSKVHVKGPKGELWRAVRPEVNVSVEGGKILVSLHPTVTLKKDKKAPALWGLTRALIQNMVKGVTEGFEKKLELVGIGYRASLEGEDLVLNVGFTHPVKVKKPEGIKFSVEKNIVSVTGIDKELVGQIAAKIRKIRPPEPYKGKGIRYVGEVVRKKLGKKAATTAA